MFTFLILLLSSFIKSQSITTNQIKCASSGGVNPVFSGGTSTWTLSIPTGSKCGFISYENQSPNPGTGQVYSYIALNVLKNNTNIGTYVNGKEFYNFTNEVSNDIITVDLTEWDSIQLQVNTASSLCSSLNVVALVGGTIGTVTVYFPSTCPIISSAIEVSSITSPVQVSSITNAVQISSVINPVLTEKTSIVTGSNHIYLISNQAQFQGGLCETLTLSNNMWLFVEPTYDVYFNPYTFQVGGNNYTVLNNGVFTGEYSFSPFAQIYLQSTDVSVEICIYANTQLGSNRLLGIIYII